MRHYPSLETALGDALKLAAGMTYKYALSGFERGGGKAVIAVPETLDAGVRKGLLRRYGKLVRQLGGLFYTGPDVGTSSDDMDVIAETGDPYIFSRTPAAGGAGASGPFTALGVFTGIQVACGHVFGNSSLADRRVLVQGVGSVGKGLVTHLRSAGAEVAFSDVEEAAIRHFRDELGLRFVAADEIYDTECDVFAPCALGGILNSNTIPRLRCRIVAGGANTQLARSEDAGLLAARGILYVPDYAVNVGGAMGITGMELLGWSRAEAERRVTDGIRDSLPKIFALAKSAGISTEAAARRIAEERLSAA